MIKVTIPKLKTGNVTIHLNNAEKLLLHLIPVWIIWLDLLMRRDLIPAPLKSNLLLFINYQFHLFRSGAMAPDREKKNSDASGIVETGVSCDTPVSPFYDASEFFFTCHPPLVWTA